MRFIDFITEERRRPDVNTRSNAIDELSRYKDNSNIYITFTTINKVGLNPQTGFDTPAGIYAYPIDKAIEYNKNNQMFATNQPYLQVFEVPTSQITRISKYKESDLKRDLEKLCVI